MQVVIDWIVGKYDLSVAVTVKIKRLLRYDAVQFSRQVPTF